MNSSEDKLDRIVEGLQQVNVNLESLRVSLSALIETCDDQEHRIRSIERWQHNLTPLLAALTFVVGAICTEILARFI